MTISQNGGVCIEALDERTGQNTIYFGVINVIWFQYTNPSLSVSLGQTPKRC